MHPPTALARGWLLAGRYRVQRVLGGGGSARVLLAHDESASDHPVALKLVSAAHRERLGWEFCRLRSLHHPHLARVQELLQVEDHGRGEALSLLVSEYVPGLSASCALDRLEEARGPKARVLSAVAVVLQAAAAVSALHETGLVHGDIKPQNLVVDADWNTKLIDLGLARPPGLSREVSGTPAFMAPELFVGQVGFAADLYALGMTLFVLSRSAGGLDPTLAPDGGAEAEGGTEDSVYNLADECGAAGRAALASLDSEAGAALFRPPLRALLRSLLDPDPTGRPASARQLVAQLSSLRAALGGPAPSEAAATALGATPALEMAARVGQLPFVGHQQALQQLQQALLQGTPCVLVCGAPGSGRSRLVREAVADLQLRSVHARARGVTYLSCAQLPVSLPAHDSVVHLQAGSQPVHAEQLAGFLAAAVVGQLRLSLVVELEAPLPGYPCCCLTALPGPDFAALVFAASDEGESAAVTSSLESLCGGLSGRVCRLMAAAYAEQAARGQPAQLQPTRLRALSDELLGAGKAPPPAARTLFAVLWLCGGQVSARALTDLPCFESNEGEGEAPLSSQTHLLLGAGLAQLGDDGQLTLCGSLAAELPMPEGRCHDLARQLLAQAALGAQARGFVQLVVGQDRRAFAALSEALQEFRQRGEVDAAAALAAAARLRAREGLVHLALCREQADALRAQGEYGAALQLLSPHVDADPASAVLAAELHRLTGDSPAARLKCERVLGANAALTSAARDTLAEARLCLARVEVDEGAVRAARALVLQVLAEGSPSEPHALRAAEVLALCAVAQGDTQGAIASLRAPIQQAAVRRQRPVAELRAIARLHATAAYVHAAAGDSAASMHHNRTAAELAAALGEVHSAAVAQVNTGNGALASGALGPACDALRRGAMALCRLGRDADVWPALHNLAHARQRVGDLDGADALLAPARQAAERSSNRYALALLTSLQAEIAFAAGREAAARAALAICPTIEGAPEHVQVVVLSRLIPVALGLGEQERAVELDLRLQAGLRGGAPEWHGERWLCAAQVAASRGESQAAVLGQRAFACERPGAQQFDLKLRAALFLAQLGQATGEASLLTRFSGEARCLLERAAVDLPAEAVARMRKFAAYRAAFATSAACERVGAEVEQAAARVLKLGRRFSGERRLSRLFHAVLDASLDLSAADRGYLLTVDAAGQPRVRAARGLSSDSLPKESAQLSASIAGHVLSTGQPLATSDAQTDARLASAQSVHALMLRSVVALPLTLGGEVRGVIYLEDRLRAGAFPAEMVPWLVELAGLAGPAIEAASLLREQRRSLRRLARARTRLSSTVQAQTVELQSLRQRVDDGGVEVEGMVGRSRALRSVIAMAERVARSDLPVLICGESGTGKELLARFIVRRSDRAQGPFVAENCSAMPEGLLESALFGHVRGAFTGAERGRRGLFELADRGTLFLDEVGDMSAAMQVRLLRVLQDGVVRPVGAERDLKVDVRLVAATHRDLRQMVADGTFREDLFYRLSTIQLRLPALRERQEDIPELVAALTARYGAGRRLRISPPALALLSACPWPGNVRQLENELRRALLLAEDIIEVSHLSECVVGQVPVVSDGLDLHGQVAALERRLVRQALKQASGNQTQAAKLLGVSRYGLQKMIRRLDPLE